MDGTEVMSSYWRGVRNGVPFLFVVGPFALLFGVVATDAGLNVFETLMFSIVVIAGAAQFTAVQLMQDNAPTVVVLVSAMTVNLRMVMYSASITPHLGPLPLWKRVIVAYFLVDQTYAASVIDFEERPQQTVAQKFAFFMGVATPICPPWYLFTLAGAWLGEAVPPELGLDFVLPIAFIALFAPALRTGAHRAAAFVAAIMALLFAFLPYNLGLIVGAVAGMMTGAEIERRAGLPADRRPGA
ncbi:AzlC family ABC transporter permease [Mameliella sediminis]|uniref:AzlC family ABC transporter permease n=1 Tax=Mameliella sediminis TaxID=2836866 RepID=UPI001C48A567|nr:AzlC family ABC transporter permease [Mameliella sediminis]MBY6113417.1 AzlC family ABC transporter permease [Antarctobacter heliothermus]MBY6143235.1 AzlC family ABC transporter permease [Mameliella alba]MBV7394715.1 AzlC family ABC transporter permease [Mameliella sediminis]MBY6163164.1 AzlC family ABC transporter permease [Mameliella alba]MBY6171428.1 AzlC family ABC transporter permease [Mameliella alba]